MDRISWIARIVSLGVVVAFGACSNPEEHPVIVHDVAAPCDASERLVTDVCVELGPDDGCVDVADVCIALCDGLTSCAEVETTLRPLDPFPIAPDGYCVPCAQP